MPKFKLSRDTSGGKAWKAVGTNPKTGRDMTLRGGQKGAKVMPGTSKAKSFMARHGEPKTAKQYVNKRIWQGKEVGGTINIPKKFF